MKTRVEWRAACRQGTFLATVSFAGKKTKGCRGATTLAVPLSSEVEEELEARLLTYLEQIDRSQLLRYVKFLQDHESDFFLQMISD